VNEVAVGLCGVTGWKWREREGREEKRWKRSVVKETEGSGLGSTAGLESVNEGIPLPETFKLGLEERAGLVNHSGKAKNNFGLNRNALFPGSVGENTKRRTGSPLSQNRDVWSVGTTVESPTTRVETVSHVC
jgi:hypothetical protein